MQPDSYIVRDIEEAVREESRLVNQAHHRMIQQRSNRYKNVDIKTCMESYYGEETHAGAVNLSKEQIIACYTHSASRAASLGVKEPLLESELINPNMRVVRFYISRLEAQEVLLGKRES